ncbi:hypothetical protein C7N43_08640 [Sphingobacteriales bacterium UPWRP_1]|nr:hypothetical protein BVG80_10750 [Sphingobacteriales bacterium TSM_CSM]PSJ77400.1 hypothetical protein C7N43_08640 [Sphingobacteriales bacterium UPWRP_1]
MTTDILYDQVAEAIAQLNPAKTLTLKAPAAMQQRLSELMEKHTAKGLLPDEKDELDHYIVLERLIRLAKIHAQQQLIG